jgi:hypothetical protein
MPVDELFAFVNDLGRPIGAYLVREANTPAGQRSHATGLR